MLIARRLAFCVMLAVWVTSSLMFLAVGMTPGHPACLLWALVQLHGCWLALENEFHHGDADCGYGAVVVPLLYLVAGLVAPIGAQSVAGEWLLSIAAAVVMSARLSLGRSFSIGGSTWVRLVDSGPYAWLRHPLLAVDLVARVCVAAAFANVWNLAAVTMYVACVVGVIVLEERWLMKRPAYVAYAGRVRYRLVPGLW